MLELTDIQAIMNFHLGLGLQWTGTGTGGRGLGDVDWGTGTGGRGLGDGDKKIINSLSTILLLRDAVINRQLTDIPHHINFQVTSLTMTPYTFVAQFFRYSFHEPAGSRIEGITSLGIVVP